jgi:hypothetical protein
MGEMGGADILEKWSRDHFYDHFVSQSEASISGGIFESPSWAEPKISTGSDVTTNDFYLLKSRRGEIKSVVI